MLGREVCCEGVACPSLEDLPSVLGLPHKASAAAAEAAVAAAIAASAAALVPVVAPLRRAASTACSAAAFAFPASFKASAGSALSREESRVGHAVDAVTRSCVGRSGGAVPPVARRALGC